MSNDLDPYRRQGFGADLQPVPPYGLLIVDLVNSFADPAVFGGGNCRHGSAAGRGAQARLAGGSKGVC